MRITSSLFAAPFFATVLAGTSSAQRSAPAPVAALDRDELVQSSQRLAALEIDKATVRVDLGQYGSGLTFSPLETMPTRAPAAWVSDDPADSLYRAARESLNSGDYRRAAQLFAQIERQYPTSAYHTDATYWRAFALYRMGGVAELHEALQALDAVQATKPATSSATYLTMNGGRVNVRTPQAGAALLATRIRGALAARGDATAAAQVARAAAGAPSCDEEDSQLRVEALNALVQLDPKSADPTIAKVLARRDECSTNLRSSAVALIGRSADSRGTDMLISTARTDPSWEVRAEAVRWLGRAPDDRVTSVLSQIATAPDQKSSVQRTAIRALVAQDSPAARQALRAIMTRTDLASDLRATALHYAAADVPIADLAKMYDNSADRQIRVEVIRLLERRPEPAAADKLIEIARIGTDPEMRRNAIAALSRRKDPRTAKLLTDILDK
ncbi:MAG: HEAT repeat domain-containing protein [Gemmatimonadaceae bacterium]